MSDFIFQDYRGQSFDKCLAKFLSDNIIASGFEPRERCYEGRFWWAVCESTKGTMEVICGRVTNFGDGGWGYKIGIAAEWENNTFNPPLNVRKAIVKHGLRVKDVYIPDSDDNKFALMLRGTLLSKVTDAILSGDDACLLEIIPFLGSDATRAAMAFFHNECSYVGRKPPKISLPVLRAIAANADDLTAKYLVIAMRDGDVELDAKVAAYIYPLVGASSQESLTKMFPDMSAQQAA